jgi:hypothetical protein
VSTSTIETADLLASRVFLILHDTFTGKPTVAPASLRCALVGAQLADLVLAGRLGVERGDVVLTHARRESTDDAAAFVLEAIATQDRPHPVPTWVGALAEPLLDTVAVRVARAGIVGRGGRGLFGRGAERFPARNLLTSARPRVRLEHMLRHPRSLDRPTAAVAAVLGAVGAERSLDVDGSREVVRAGLAAARDRLPADLAELVSGVEAANAAPPPSSLRLRPSDG